ncbi:hypothetical protein DNTS_017098 [Danionella cerebrum]|uniref:Uncharacterized protein n=1 Tax=Danionella cerebrum TaxID=2873325 RepID=A0A553NG15_9TELE|nr:hypothetical protein DNTS_017098 [Danionella translucida]
MNFPANRRQACTKDPPCMRGWMTQRRTKIKTLSRTIFSLSATRSYGINTSRMQCCDFVVFSDVLSESSKPLDERVEARGPGRTPLGSGAPDFDSVMARCFYEACLLMKEQKPMAFDCHHLSYIVSEHSLMMVPSHSSLKT